MRSAARRRRHLVQELLREDAVRDPLWIEAFRHVPRHVFLPRFFVPHGNRWAAVARGDANWLPLVYSDTVLVTQLDDDPGLWERARREGPVPGTPTSSSSMPGIMALMLEHLQFREGDHVLEIGTGTGYNAALLCHRLGDARVSTVDIDPTLCRQARAALATIGYHPECEVADGEKGFPPSAPYDRVLSTCSVSHLPPAWLEQTRPGGLVLTTLNRPIGAGMVLVAAGEGATGEGVVLATDGRFMPMRAHRRADTVTLLAGSDGPGDDVTARPTDLPLETVLNPAHAFEFFVSLELPGLMAAAHPQTGELSLLVHPDGSWAGHHGTDGGHVVQQGGPRKLWDAVEAAYRRWHELGSPPRDAFTVSVRGERQSIRFAGHEWPLHRED
ncbi:ATP-grasp peptide maturase system methyltransferase [Prauserella oleivorans]|uniref:Protein-L-isoaspartate O-methyltransferase n=1 Tax=Prauserella oleivorans TaxID=1478153 RepID=A0ABW5W4K8_9PSEU